MWRNRLVSVPNKEADYKDIQINLLEFITKQTVVNEKLIMLCLDLVTLKQDIKNLSLKR